MIIVQKVMDSNPGRPKLKHLQGFIYTVRIYAKANAFEMRTSNFKRSIQKIFFTKTKLNQYQRHSKVVKNCNNSLRNFDISLLHRGPLILTWRNRKEGDLRQRQKVQEDQQGGHPAAYESGFLIWQLRHQNRGMFQHLCTLLWHKYR